MSCNGCRVLRKGCGETCVLRSCLHWIESPEAQGNATLFLAKFFGRSDLMSFISAVPDHHRPALFQSLLFEACGRTVNPVNGAVGLLSSGNWHVCHAAVETVLSGGALRPIQGVLTPKLDESSAAASETSWPSHYFPSLPSINDPKQELYSGGRGSSFPIIEKFRRDSISLSSEESVMTKSFGIDDRKERKLLNLFF
ncbi:Lateral organ boundaries domain containing protein [Parasponia andersonii]|uniref:Lateral organ boundaries domain containing protein n=1 Tax=Parasponia andersonii TaxID=3476 RepID=A0A2P5BZQ4_PARAD|nr:Lateral organ boundaries domain containing protein [Parasponia andersonii]